MKTVIAFLAGISVGVVTALLLAPESGDDLRAQIRAEAASERNRLHGEYKKAQQKTHDKIDQMHQDLSAAMDKGPQVETADVDVEVEVGEEEVTTSA